MNEKKKTMMEDLVALTKRRGFVFPSSEIYGGMSAIYDYGHYGTLLKNNIRDAWWRHMVQLRDDVVGLDSAIFMHPTTWVASGHVESFDDPQIDCRACKARMRADHVLEQFDVVADKMPISYINEQLDLLRAAQKLTCVACGSKDLTEAKQFSLMVKSNVGSPTDHLSEEHVVYLRPETCGGIYLEYKNTVDSTRMKVPFGIAQVGKAFRNEIVARQFVFRTREFEQMEMQYFVHPSAVEKSYDAWKAVRWQWYMDLGMTEKDLRWHEHDKLAHYASQAYDIEYNFRSLGGFKEVEGIHARGDWDLSQHSKHSGKTLDYTDDKTGEKFIPHIVETSAGLGRLFLMFLDKAYTVEDLDGGATRTVLRLPAQLAPIKIAVFPLLKNKPELVEKARAIYDMLKIRYMCEFDDHGNVGKRYRRQDEIGTPYAVTIDFDTVEKGIVTVRDRDTMQQQAVPVEELESFFADALRL